MGGGGFAQPVMHNGPYLEGRALILPICLIISLFFLWGFSYGLLDVLNAHFRNVLGITRLESTGLQVAYFGGGYFVFSPFAGQFMRRFGYKRAINLGLTLYSLGAIFFWPVAHYANAENRRACFGGFVACTFVLACGLATLEVAANSYATVIGNPKSAAMRLQFCQAWNGVASFIGPLIASHVFFTGKDQNNLNSVQFVYLAVAAAGLAVNIMFVIVKMPEVSEEVLEAMAAAEGAGGATKPLWKQYNAIGGFIAQFCYVGAQVTVASFFIFYVNENSGQSESRASFLLSMSLLMFTGGRFVGVAFLNFVAADFLLIVYVIICIVLTCVTALISGDGSIATIMLIFFFDIMYPIIFVLGTENLGSETRRGSALLVMGVAGGAVFPPAQGGMSDGIGGARGVRLSYFVPFVGFVIVLLYVLTHWIRAGFPIKKPVEYVLKQEDEELAKNATIQTNAFTGIITQPISLVRTIETTDEGLQKVRTRDGPEPAVSALFKVRTVDRVTSIKEHHAEK